MAKPACTRTVSLVAGVSDEVGPYFRSYCSRNRKGTVFIKDLADRMGYCKAHGYSSFTRLLYSRNTEEIKLFIPVVENVLLVYNVVRLFCIKKIKRNYGRRVDAKNNSDGQKKRPVII